jgi:hypothetical protein
VISWFQSLFSQIQLVPRTKWWTDIDDTLTTDNHVDLGTIHKVM